MQNQGMPRTDTSCIPSSSVHVRSPVLKSESPGFVHPHVPYEDWLWHPVSPPIWRTSDKCNEAWYQTKDAHHRVRGGCWLGLIKVIKEEPYLDLGTVAVLQRVRNQTNMLIALGALGIAMNTPTEAAQNRISFKTLPPWSDVEVDEVTLAKYAHSPGKIVWANFVGIMARGMPETLVILPLPDRVTSDRAPGPGPIRLSDWRPIAEDWLRGAKVILHSDSAKAYGMAIEGVIGTKVVHQKKKIDGCGRSRTSLRRWRSAPQMDVWCPLRPAPSG